MTVEERILEARKILALGARRALEAQATRTPQPVAVTEGGKDSAGNKSSR